MKKLTYAILVIIMSFSLVSCSNIDSTKVISDLNNQITSIRADKNKAENEVKKLEKENKDLVNQMDTEFDTMKKTSALHWMEQTNWDKLIIKDDSNTVVITDKALLHPTYIIGRVYNGSGGPFWQEKYSYEFVKGDKNYKIKVIDDLGDDLNFKYNGQMYSSQLRLDSYYRSFLPGPDFVKSGSTLCKMYLAPVMKFVDKNGSIALTESFRIKGIVQAMQSGLNDRSIFALNRDVSNPGKLRANATFYYYGTKIELKVYQKYVSLSESAQYSKWYQIKNPNDIVGVMHVS